MLRLAISIALTSVYACNTGEGVSGGGGSQGESGDATDGGSWLTGSWKGIYKKKEAAADGSFGDTSAEVMFKETENRAGEFTLKLPALDNVQVTGIYHDFQGKSLLLEIKQSNLSTIGSPNSSADIGYDLIGDGLELNNDRVTIRLFRDDKPAADNTDDGGKDPNKDAVIDDWLCKDKQGFNWKIDISDANFALDVFDPTGARESISMKGDLKITRGQTDADAVLTVTSSTQKDKYKDLELRANTIGTDNMNLRRMDQNAEGAVGVAEIMQCNTI